MFESAKRTCPKLESATDMSRGYSVFQAVAEASRCLLCHDAPCSRDCPAGTDPGTFIRKLRLRNLKGAVRTIKSNNILGGVCGIVCPVETLCQKACSATGIDHPIQIGKLQRFLVEHGWQVGFEPIRKAPARPGKVAIVGGGPAGLSCAAELAKAGVDVTVHEARPAVGGNLRFGVPEFRLNAEFFERELQDILKLGVKLVCNARIGADGADRLLGEGYAAVFLATGIWKAKTLDVPGWGLGNVTTSTEFLEAMRSGGSERIRAMVAGRNVAVAGGGSVAVDVACTSRVLGASKVYMLYRRSLREMPASQDELEMAAANAVSIRAQSVVTRLIGEDGHVVGLEGIETDWKVPGDVSAANLVTVPGTEFKLKVDAFVAAIGNEPLPETRALAGAIRFARNGLIETADDGVSTSRDHVYAGGDIIRGSGTVVEAVADGKRAARRILEKLGE